jgi:hypothetical protein
VRPFRLALATALTVAAFAAPVGAHADDTECPGRSGPTIALQPYVCAGTETEGWGGSLYAYAGTCATGPCTVVTVPVEDTVIVVAGIVNDVWDDITP